MKTVGLALIAAFSVAACGGNPASPQQPTGPAAAATLSVKIDALGSAVAIAAVDAVAFEAAAPNANKPRFVLAFGDGASTETPTATHVYAAPGTYTATLTVIDAANRQSVVTQTVPVKSLIAGWYQAGPNSQAQQFEVRKIVITEQHGTDVRGTYSNLGARDHAFSGTVTVDRFLQITTDDGTERFSGTVPSLVSGENAPFALNASGGTASGRTLSFVPIVGNPTPTAPHAALAIRYTHQVPIAGYDVTFDASGSRGDGLLYGIEFGDGSLTTDPIARHAFDRPVGLARAVVVDRFGRADEVLSGVEWGQMLATGPVWISQFANTAAGRTENRRLSFTSQRGRHLTGLYTHPEGTTSSFTADLVGDTDISIRLDDGTIDFSGLITYDSGPPPNFGSGYASLKTRGGSADGATLVFYPRYSD